jgi:hypothetical protein
MERCYSFKGRIATFFFINIFLDTHNKGVMVWAYFPHVNIPACSVTESYA